MPSVSARDIILSFIRSRKASSRNEKRFAADNDSTIASQHTDPETVQNASAYGEKFHGQHIRHHRSSASLDSASSSSTHGSSSDVSPGVGSSVVLENGLTADQNRKILAAF
ncbi:hypothetical protein HDV00_012214 [Rhizophlyctis rosea]|nr:hypothetical protein HDV00_012214 [Rhizophlyctis rosea]